MLIEHKTPVTVLTGFLGSGKTTLLNRILTEQHGKKIAVIENEFGEIGVDNELVIGADEEIFEMNNGCICCTVRGDLIRILGNLMKRKDKLDYILIETTGLADPAPVAQTFFVDDEMKEQYSIDGIVTVIDAKHVLMHIEDSDECQQQIAFADVILLNKIDLINPAELQELENRIRRMNPMAKIHHTQNCELAIDNILNVKAFDLSKKVEFNPDFLKEELPFEWAGVYELDNKNYDWILQAGPDETMDMLIEPISDLDENTIEKAKKKAIIQFSEEALSKKNKAYLHSKGKLNQLVLPNSESIFKIKPTEAGKYIFLTQHLPEEFSAVLQADNQIIEPIWQNEYAASHEHDDEVTSVGISLEGNLDGYKLNTWLSKLLQEKGVDIFRMKGILSIQNEPRRFVFQGVHMLFDGKPDRIWEKNEPRLNQLVFIGRNLDRQELNKSFRACLAKG
ncbi:MAG: GTP-binding protein [Microscillaceae bacterium]|jgi:G3E family GTPase|nr:GTP-binding protein [Microscillaceae bacterium]